MDKTPDYFCRKCKTEYFEEQECDWCPEERTKYKFPGTGRGSGKNRVTEKTCNTCSGTGELPKSDSWGNYACHQCCQIAYNGAGEEYGGR